MCRLKVCVALIAACFLQAAFAARTVLVVNEDNDRYLLTAKADDLTEDGIRKYFDSVVAGGGVTHFFMCVNGQRTSYGSKVWEPIWKGIGQPARNGATNWPWCVNAKILHDRGIDPWRIWLERAREKDVSPWISLRMNDVHFANNPQRICRNEDYWYDHPEWYRVPNCVRDGKRDWADYAWDYAHLEVREHFLDLVREVLERWDMDGLELDWMRQCRCLTPGRERELGYVLTDFMRNVRKLADEASARRGRQIKIGVRVPTTLGCALSLGFEVPVWAKEGLFDLISPSPIYSAPDFDMDVSEWVRIVKGLNPAAILVPGTDVNIFNGRNREFCIFEDLALVRGWVANASGADGHYFFNAPYWRKGEREALYAGSLTGPGEARMRRRFPVTYHEAGATLADRDLQLDRIGPGTGRVYRVRVTRGPADKTARIALAYNRPDPPPAIELNGRPVLAPAERIDAKEISPTPTYLRGCWTWCVPAEEVVDGINRIRVVPSKQPVGLITWLEISLGGQGSDVTESSASHERRLRLDDYHDKMKAGWLGQMIGVEWGLSTEFKYQGRTISDAEVPVWRPEINVSGTSMYCHNRSDRECQIPIVQMGYFGRLPVLLFRLNGWDARSPSGLPAPTGETRRRPSDALPTVGDCSILSA